MAKPCTESAADLYSRSLASAWLAVRDSRVHNHTDRVLRHRASPASRYRLRGILVEDDHRRSLAKRSDMVRLDTAGFRSFGKPVVSALTPPPRSDQSDVAARLRAPRRILPVSRPGHPHRLCPAAALLRTEPLGRI